MADGKWLIEGHYPTQAKGRLEWGTQHLLPGVAKLLGTSPVFSFPQSATKESLRTLVLPLLVSHWCEDLLHLCNQFPIVGLIVPRNVAFYGFWICRAKEGRRNIVVLA